MRLLLVHGMGRTSLSLELLARSLRRAGHAVESVGYVSAFEPFDRIRRRVRDRLELMARQAGPYAVIGHSLGGLALRAALAGIEPAPFHFFMLGTPNRPPRLAARLAHRPLYRWIHGESGQLLARAEFFAGLPVPTVPYTIIAGTAGPRGRHSLFGDDLNDWVVAVDETRIGPDDTLLTFPVSHTFMMNDRRVQLAIEAVLR